ncbi:hypothetical protein OCK74_09105 [Chitinophagaceae bacterium LB-8]|uniref:Uncharacterized protein n=1 Tax=Paraflavisolibacter caeni TaxID=2982496 RepID=A0A9X2XX24_9BACT|nr:hypothetical protein [Paraflavisolibacter caeni]MCU7549273.1 hypothetical protein [Paraflavisolibacter caeni]
MACLCFGYVVWKHKVGYCASEAQERSRQQRRRAQMWAAGGLNPAEVNDRRRGAEWNPVSLCADCFAERYVQALGYCLCVKVWSVAFVFW